MRTNTTASVGVAAAELGGVGSPGFPFPPTGPPLLIDFTRNDTSFFDALPRSRSPSAQAIPSRKTGRGRSPPCSAGSSGSKEPLMSRGGREGGHGREPAVRRPRQGSAGGALPQARVARTRGATTAGDARAGWGEATNTGRRLAGQRRGRPSRGSSSCTLLPPLAACSLAVLAFLGDPASSFQVQFLLPGQLGLCARWG